MCRPEVCRGAGEGATCSCPPPWSQGRSCGALGHPVDVPSALCVPAGGTSGLLVLVGGFQEADLPQDMAPGLVSGAVLTSCQTIVPSVK